jgi:hypothetical protein
MVYIDLEELSKKTAFRWICSLQKYVQKFLHFFLAPRQGVVIEFVPPDLWRNLTGNFYAAVFAKEPLKCAEVIVQLTNRPLLALEDYFDEVFHMAFWSLAISLYVSRYSSHSAIHPALQFKPWAKEVGDNNVLARKHLS